MFSLFYWIISNSRKLYCMCALLCRTLPVCDRSYHVSEMLARLLPEWHGEHMLGVQLGKFCKSNSSNCVQRVLYRYISNRGWCVGLPALCLRILSECNRIKHVCPMPQRILCKHNWINWV